MRFAGDLAGVSIDITDKALTAFTKRLGEAANGQGELVNILQWNGIQVRDNKGKVGEATNALEEGDLRALEAAPKRMVTEREALGRRSPTSRRSAAAAVRWR